MENILTLMDLCKEGSVAIKINPHNKSRTSLSEYLYNNSLDYHLERDMALKIIKKNQLIEIEFSFIPNRRTVVYGVEINDTVLIAIKEVKEYIKERKNSNFKKFT